MRSAEKFSLGLKLGPSKTPVLWMVCLSCPFLAGLRDFTYLCFAASHPPPNAQPTFLVVRESLRPMKALSENLCSSLPSLPAECLCGIKLVVLVGMGAGSGFGAEQRVGIAGGLLRWVLPSGMGMVTHLFKAIRSRSPASSRRSTQVTAAGVSSFQTQSIEEGRRGGQCPHRELCTPQAQPGVSTPRMSMFSAVGWVRTTVTTLAVPLQSHKARRMTK